MLLHYLQHQQQSIIMRWWCALKNALLVCLAMNLLGQTLGDGNGGSSSSSSSGRRTAAAAGDKIDYTSSLAAATSAASKLFINNGFAAMLAANATTAASTATTTSPLLTAKSSVAGNNQQKGSLPTHRMIGGKCAHSGATLLKSACVFVSETSRVINRCAQLVGASVK